MRTTVKKAAKKNSKYSTADGHHYLTKRITVAKAKAAGKKAARGAMQTMGFVVVAEKGLIVKKYADGTREILGRIKKAKPSNRIALD